MGLDTEDFPDELLSDCEISEEDEKILELLTNPFKKDKYLS